MNHLLLSLVICATLGFGSVAFAKEAKKADQAKPVNTKCPVSDEAADPKVTVKHEGQTIAFCCKGCVKDFKKDPAKYVEKVAAEQGEGAADKGAEKAEGKDKKAGKTVNKNCAVHPENAVDASVAAADYKGKKVGFCCEDCAKEFNDDPDRFAKNVK